MIKESTLGADNYQQVTTAKASMATIDVRQVEREAQRRTLRVAVLAFALLVAAGSLLGLLNRGPRPVTAPPSFIADKLGADLPRQRLSHRLAGDATLTIDRSGFAVQNRAGSVRLSSIDRPAGSWLGHARGAQRNTAFGNEAIVLDRNATGVGGEQFLTVGKGYGTHTWSWNLSSTFGRPRVGDDGYVAFIRGHYLTQKMFVKPVRILDASGKDVTPKGLAWQIGIDRSGHYLLQLPLDDSKLPLPYVIDPGITTDVFLGTTGNTTASLNLALNVPTGTKADDLLLAHIAWKIAAAGTTISVTKPAAWTQAIAPGASGTGTTDIGGGVYWKTASSTDGNGSTSYTWALSTAEIASGGIGAYAGVEATSPIDNSASLGTVRPGSNTTVLPMPSLLPTVNNTEVVSLIGWNARDTGALLTAPAGEAVRWRTNNSGVVTSFSSDLLQTTAATVSTNATQPNGKVASMTYRVSLKPDTTAPAMSSAVVAADGVTVTVTWSENIDQTQAVPGSAFSIAPNGGAGVAGTATAVSYPAANQTRFTLSSTVHHLDSLALTYTKPGSNPMVGDFAANAAVTATLNNASITNNTSNASPTTPTLVSPADAARLNSATPTLTAKFLDPDTQDTGKVTFEVCTTSNCSTSLGTFDSTSTTLAVNANGSAAVPGGYNLANGTTYYWRAKDVDSSAASSSFSAIQSFLVDTAAPTMSSATIAANGTTVTITWSENLDQTQAVPGSSFSIAPNGGAGIAGTASAVSYPAANQTQFTLSSAVHHLDSLALTYTKPGSNPMVRDTALATGNPAATATLNNASITNNTTNASPSTPTLVSPADAARLNTATPTLTAKFLDPDTQDTGKVTFEVCTTSNCSSSLGTFDSTSTTLAVNANGSAAVPGGYNLANGTTYYWRAKNVDSSAASSSFSAIQSFLVDTAAPTMSSATVAADGTTVTITWSENLDQTQAVPGSAFSITPNGGSAIAGTAAAVSYPAANQTQFTLSSGVHHLDSLALTYTKPGSDPMVRDTALATGNPAATATLNNASITNNTSNVSPSTPTLVGPADAARLNSATPTLTATFSDPDSQDTGKVTFEVCTTNNCSSSLGTFDSTSTTLAVNANGSAAVPGGYNLANGTTYYWRAKNVDSSAASSSFSAIQSFLVDTAVPTMSSATVGADGTTVTVTWSESLDQTQAVPGSSFSIAPNGGAGIAGTASAVSYPAANKTQFTLSSGVHHLDSLALTYSKPGSNPMVRDTALATGNAAATATLNNASITNNTSNVSASTPTLVSPADAARVNTATPTLTATFLDADTQDTGKVTFEVCSTSNCSTSLGTFDSTSTNLAVNANGSAAVPAGFNLASGTTYYWRAENVDSSSGGSSFTSTRSFLVDTAAPTMSSATVAADGVTVTITWSENLDQTQAVPGSAYSIAPNGGSAIAGTAAAVSYPAANQTQFTLSSTVHHLDSLALTYTKPGSNPMVRDTALATGNPAATATLNNASITNNTSNVSPSTPTLASPTDAARLSTTTPTLTATFSDPDTQDTGKVTFEVCTTNNCSSSLGTFDSTSTNLAVNANGSAAVPGGYNLANGTTYYWRAKNVDSSAASSSFSAIQSFLVDTAAPTMSSATVAADGTTVTITWSENLDQAQALAGTTYSVAPNGGAGVAGTAAAVSYPAADKTQFTLSSAVHHLDSLAVTYAKPSSDPMVRDTAQATGNAAATATLNNASITNNTTSVAPSSPTLVSPADAARLNSTPTLTATFGDPDSEDTGKVTFEVCSTSNCSSSLGTFDSTSTSLTVGANGSAAVPGGFNLASGATYYWRAKNVDSSAAGSSFTATRSFLVDTAAPTMSSATVAADGTTVTVTWSENLDQTQAVSSNAYAIVPNGGIGIAGTAAAISYPAANQTRFTLFSAVHHLDTLALTYTKPGSDPMVRDTALATGNPAATATLLNVSITNNTTNVAPSTPTLVGPADAARLNTTTPTLTATFLDSDSQDTGKVTFEVCTTSNCSSSLGTFDSSSTNLSVNANGSAAVPAGLNLADGTTYYWRAKNVDTAAASSSFSAIQSFLVDTAAPTMSSAVVAADGVTATVTWSENLDQTQAVAGSSFTVAPNGGAGIAGTASAVSYPAADQTQFTLSSDVDHLDSLALSYTKPGSNPMVRDIAGNAAATATLNNASITNNASNGSPSTPILVSPADAARVNTATPTLSATFLDPDSNDTGKVTFEVCSTSNCSSSLGTFDSSSTNLAVNANGSAAVPGGFNLASDTTYYWRAENIDASAAASSYSATRSFTVDTTAPTMSSATVAANGTTVTITWSENLDQTLAVPGNAYAIAPNGGIGIAGTAAAISYPAANQTRFTLSSAVHHLDTLDLTYTKPGSDPMIRDTAPATGNAAVTATLANAFITNSTTNAGPNVPVLVSPADANTVGSYTPTLTASFDDPDANDTGKITFEVCTTSDCSTSLGTFDSTNTSLANNQSGSAQVPAGYGLIENDTYYWRAKSTDSGSSVSSFSSIWSFTPITDSAPDVPSLVSPAGGSYSTTATPTLTATFTDPDPSDTGTITFRICGNATCTAGGDPILTFASASGIVNGADGAAAVPAGLLDGSYFWQARSTDSLNVQSAYSAGRALTIDATAPTNVFSLTGVSVAGGFPVAFYPGAGSTIYYNGAAGIGARSFSIRAAVTDATSGPASVTTQSFAADASNMAHTYATTTAPGAGVFDTNSFTYTALTTGNASVDVFTSDLAGNASSTTSFTLQNDAAAPSGSVTSPAAGAYNASGWTGTLTGSAADSGAGVDAVKISIRDVTAGGSSCWNGAGAFDQPCPNFVAAAGTTSWSYGLAAGALTDGHTYAITVETIDKVGNTDAAAATRSFDFDTSAPTITAANVASDGVTVTATWSENLGQGQAVAGSAFSVTPNGGSAVAGTGAAVAYPAANQTRFTLSAAVHHADLLTLDYTQPGGNPMVRDTVTPTGNPAVTVAGLAVANNTADVAPTTPALGAPADGVFINSTTPTLSATFSDPDPSDTGKVTFEVCSTSNCSSSLGTFQSATVANGASGSTQVPGAFNLQTATTYYWRAQNIDGLNATSSFSSTRSFSVDTTAPSLSITAPQAVTGNDFQYYDGMTTKLWLNANQAGSFKLTSTASDAQSSLASVDFPAIFGTGGNAGTPNAGTYESATYAFDGTVTPFGSPGAKTVTASNGVTVPAPNTTNGQITIAADGAAPSPFALGEPADGTTVRQTTVSAAPTDGAGSGIRQVAFSFCDVTSHPACDPTNTGLFGVQIGSTQTIAAGGIYSVTWTDVLTDGHQYALAAVATDNVGHTRTSTLSTVTVDSSAPNVAVSAPNAVSGGQYQHYDAASKTLWLNSHQAGSFTLAATADDPQSGISSVTFPALLGSSSNVGTGSGTYTSGATYTFDGTGTPLTAPGAKSITAANGVTDPSPGTSSDALSVDVDGVAPATSPQFPLNNGSYDNTTWNIGSAGCTGAPASGICGTVADPGSSAGVASVKLSIKDSTTGLYYDGAGFTLGSQTYLTAVPSGSNWSCGLDQSKLTSPHVYVIELFAVDNVGNAELHQTIRFTYGSDVGAPATALALAGATNASLYQASGSDYNLYYRTTGGNGGFTLHAVSTDPSGVDTVTFPNLSATSGFSGSGGTSTNGSNADPYTVDSSGYSFTSAATTPPGQKTVTSVDLRGNSGDDTLTFLLDNAAPTGGTLTVTPVGASSFVTATNLTVGHLDYTADGTGSGVASSSLTVASASLANGACGTFGAESPASDGAFTATDGTCYRFTLTGTDQVGNVASVSTTRKVDTTAPSQPGVTFTGLSSGNTFDDAAGTLYYRPSAAGTFTVNANGSIDAESGIKAGSPGYTFSALANFAGATQTGNRVDVTFTGASTGGGSYTAHSTDNAGLDSADATFSVTADSAAPISGALNVNGTAATAGGSSSYLTASTTIAIGSRTDYTDPSSGIASSTLTMESATLANDTCGSFGSASTIAGTTSQSVSDAHCYRFTLTGTDHVGNSTSLSTIVKVDTTAPVAPSVSFSGLSTGNTFVAGSTLFYRPSNGGTFTVNANGATDPETGIKPGNAGYTFSALSGFTSTAQIGNRLDVTFDAASTGSGADSVAAVNNASVGSSATAFTVTADAAAPTGGSLAINPYSGSLTVSIGETAFADAGSGIASNVLTRSSPQAPSAGVCPAGGYTGSVAATLSDTVPSDGQCYEYTLTGTDNVGNVATYDAIVLVDTTGPAGGSIQYVDGPASLNAISVDWDSGTDAESGIGTVRVERTTALVTAGACGSLGSFTTLIANATVSPIVDSAVSAGNCYAYRIVVTNNAGVDSTFSSPSVARLTSALPIQLVPGNPAGSILSGSTLYLGPSSANLPFKLQLTTLGANGVTSATWQGKSGSLHSAPATDTTATNPPFDSGVYTWDGTAPLIDSIQVSRDPGAAVESVNVVSDTNDPTGTINYTDGFYASHSVHVATTASDGQSGVASTQVLRAETTLTGATCDTAAPSWSSFSPITLSGGGNDTTVTDGHCYRYEVVVTDNVGNSYTAGSANVAKIPDITAPTFLAGSTNAAGTQLTITMSEPLDASATTQPGAFTITYDGVVQPTATGIGYAGQSIVLNLASAPNNSEIVKVRYSQPSTAGDRVRDIAAPTENESANFGPVAVVNNTTDTVAPSLVSASVNSTTLTLVFSEALAGTAPDASAFTVSTGSTSRSVTGVSMSGKTITFTIAPAVGSADNVVVSYAVPAMNALHDAAGNATTSFIAAAANQTPIVPPGDTGVSAPAPATPVFVSSSPNDGSTVRGVSTITLTASQSADWTNMNVTRPDGSITALQDASGQAATWAFAPTAEGLYVIRGTLSGGGGTDDVLSHFTIWAPGTGGSNGTVPEVQKNAVPFAPGELESSDGLTVFDWSADTFSDAVVVEVKPRPAATLAGLPADAVVVDVTAFVRSTHAPVFALNGVADILFPHATPGSHPLTSQDGTTWRDIPQVPTLNLPAGQTDGWFADSDGTIHVLTRHLTFYALVGPQASTKLAMRVLTVRRLWLHGRSFIAVRMSLTTPARVTGLFVGSDGSIVPGQTIRTPTRHAGVTILRIPLRVTKPGLYRLQMHAESDGQVVNRTALIRFLTKRPASPVWQDVRPLRIAIVDGVKGLGSLGDRLGHGYLVRGVADSALYTVVDTKFPTAAAAVVVDLGTLPASTLATLHALLPEVKIVGLTGSPARALYYRSVGVSAVLPRTASAATVAKTITSLLRSH